MQRDVVHATSLHPPTVAPSSPHAPVVLVVAPSTCENPRYLSNATVDAIDHGCIPTRYKARDLAPDAPLMIYGDNGLTWRMSRQAEKARDEGRRVVLIYMGRPTVEHATKVESTIHPRHIMFR